MVNFNRENRGWFFSTASSPERAQEVKERLDNLGITEAEIEEIGLPFMLVDETLEDDELLEYVKELRSSKPIDIKVDNTSNDNPLEISQDNEEEVYKQQEEDNINTDYNNAELTEEDLKESIAYEEEIPTLNEVAEIPNLDIETEEELKPKVKKTRKKTIKKKEEVNNTPPENLLNMSDLSIKEVDVSKLNILKLPTTDVQNNFFNHLKTVFPVYEVTLPQSGYTAQLRGLTVQEIDMFKNSVYNNSASIEDKLEDFIYKCIQDTSIGNMTIEEFRKNTSALDYNILVFAALHQTFGRINKFSIVCPACQTKNEKDIATVHLIHNKSEKLNEKINEIVTANDKQEAVQNSLLKTFNKNIQDPYTGLILSIKYFNLDKNRKINTYINSLKIEDESIRSRKYSLSLAVDKLYLPQYDINKKLVGYGETESLVEIWKYLDTIPQKSVDDIITTIDNSLLEYVITFKLPDTVCQGCKSKIEGTNISVEQYFLAEALPELFQ